MYSHKLMKTKSHVLNNPFFGDFSTSLIFPHPSSINLLSPQSSFGMSKDTAKSKAFFNFSFKRPC